MLVIVPYLVQHPGTSVASASEIFDVPRDQLRRDPRWARLGLAGFKADLVAAHRAGELALARADLVAAMDPALVAASEIAVDGASFHFVVKERAP